MRKCNHNEVGKSIYVVQRDVAMCANVCNFRLSNFEQNEPLQLIFLCDFMLNVAVDSGQACLICATISLAIF